MGNTKSSTATMEWTTFTAAAAAAAVGCGDGLRRVATAARQKKATTASS